MLAKKTYFGPNFFVHVTRHLSIEVNIVLDATVDNIMIDDVVSNLGVQLDRLCHLFHFQSGRTAIKSTGKCPRVGIQRRSVFIGKLFKNLNVVRVLILWH